MNDIPDDIMKVAQKIADEWASQEVGALEGAIEDISRAIKAERDRCASVCFKLAGGDEFKNDSYSMEATCGRAILRGEQP